MVLAVLPGIAVLLDKGFNDNNDGDEGNDFKSNIDDYDDGENYDCDDSNFGDTAEDGDVTGDVDDIISGD